MSLKDSFEQIGMAGFENRINHLNVDNVSANTGAHTGLGTKIYEEYAPWLTVICCFNCRLDLAIKYALKSTFFMKLIQC